MTIAQMRARAIRDARKASKADRFDRRVPVLDRDFDNLELWG